MPAAMVGHINLGVAKGNSASASTAAKYQPAPKRGSLAHSNTATITNQSFSYSVVQNGPSHLNHVKGYSTRKLINETKTMMTNNNGGTSAGQPPQHMGTSILQSQTSNLSTSMPPNPTNQSIISNSTPLSFPNLNRTLLQHHQQHVTASSPPQSSSPPNHKASAAHHSSRPIPSSDKPSQSSTAQNSNSSRNNSTRLQSQKSGASLL